MPDKFHFLPFMISAVASVPGAKVNINRMIEAIIIAILTAGFTTWAATKVLNVQMIGLEQRLQRTEDLEKSNTEQLRVDIREVRNIMNEHLVSGSKK